MAPEPVPVAGVTVTPGTVELSVGDSIRLSAVAVDSLGRVLDAGGTWRSSAPGIAAVDSTGRVTGVSAGVATVTAELQGVSGSASVTVVDPVPPEAPTELTTEVTGPAAVEVTWTDASDNEDVFEVQRERVGFSSFAPLAVLGAGATSLRDTTVVGGATYRYRVRAINEFGASGFSGPVEAEIPVGTLEIRTSGLPVAPLGQEYSVSLVIGGGVPPVTWSLVSGPLPPGIVLDRDEGVLAGAPVTLGTFPFTLAATSSDGQRAQVELELVVQPGPVGIRTRVLPVGVVGAPYEAELEASGGDGVAYAWSVTSGSPPPGLSLGPAGLLSGTPAEPGSFSVTLFVRSGGRTAARRFIIAVTPPPSQGYDVELAYVSPVSATHLAAFEAARAQWTGLIIADETDQPGPLQACGSFHAGVQGPVDDVLIFVEVDSIDGPGGTLGRAGPCFVRTPSLKPITGAMIFDEADLDRLATRDLLRPVILHEMGHVFGIGGLWEEQGLLTGECLVDPVFTGPRAITAFDEAGGTLYSGEPVPVEDGGSINDGSNCVHWRESVMGTELMTPFLNSGENPLSAITVESLADQGYTVEPAGAEAYDLPRPVPVGAARAAPGPGGTVGVFLGDDLLRIPLRRVHPDGRVEVDDRVGPGGDAERGGGGR
jgi:hypothetical protein